MQGVFLRLNDSLAAVDSAGQLSFSPFRSTTIARVARWFGKTMSENFVPWLVDVPVSFCSSAFVWVLS